MSPSTFFIKVEEYCLLMTVQKCCTGRYWLAGWSQRMGYCSTTQRVTHAIDVYIWTTCLVGTLFEGILLLTVQPLFAYKKEKEQFHQVFSSGDTEFKKQKNKQTKGSVLFIENCCTSKLSEERKCCFLFLLYTRTIGGLIERKLQRLRSWFNIDAQLITHSQCPF